MSGKFQYLERRILDHFLGATASTAPANVYVALLTTVPTTDVPAGLVEVTGGNYARVTVANNATNWPAAAGVEPATKSNGTVIAYPTPSATWGLLKGFAVYDALTAGNPFYWGTIPNVTVNATDPAPSFAIGTLQITEA